MTRVQREVRARQRAVIAFDDMPHMTLSPEKDGQLWRGGVHGLHPNQRQSLLSPREAFIQGFHAGARWGRADVLKQKRARIRVKQTGAKP